MAPGISDYGARSAELVDALSRLNRYLGDDARQETVEEDLLRLGARPRAALGLVPQPGGAPPSSTDCLAATLLDLQNGNALIAAGLQRSGVGVETSRPLLVETRQQIEASRLALLSDAPVRQGFETVWQVQSATAESAIGGFREYSSKVLHEIRDQAKSMLLMAIDKLGKLDLAGIGELVVRIGQSLPFAATVGRLVNEGVALIKRAIDGLSALLGHETFGAAREAVGKIWESAGDLGEALLGVLLGIDAVEARIEQTLAAPYPPLDAVDRATNLLAPLAGAFNRDVKLLRSLLAAIAFAGTLLGWLNIAGPWLATGLGIAYLTAMAATVLLGRAYSGAGPLPIREQGVEQIAGTMRTG